MAQIAREGQIETWSADHVDGFLRENEAAQKDAVENSDFGWFGRYPGAYELAYEVMAVAEDDARDRAGARLDLPDGWGLLLDIAPIDHDEQPRA